MKKLFLGPGYVLRIPYEEPTQINSSWFLDSSSKSISSIKIVEIRRGYFYQEWNYPLIPKELEKASEIDILLYEDLITTI